LVRVRQAREVIPILTGRTVLHAGPPITAERLCGPMRGAILGASVLEGWAKTAEESARILDRGQITLRCAHDCNAVGPMAGIISGSMPVFEVRDETSKTTAYSTINEGVGAVLRFGAYDARVIDRLRWMADTLAPALDRGLQHLEGIVLLPLMNRALSMGDEMHQRNIAATSLLFRALTPALAKQSAPANAIVRIMQFLSENDQFFLNVAMAACKAMMDGARGISYCTAVTAMSRNGVEFGIRVSGLGDTWYVAPSPVPDGLYFPGYGAADANPDMGDSAIVETAGLGAFAMAAAPAVAGFVGLASAREATATTQAMSELTLGPSPHFKIPALDFAGTPTGIDIRRIVEVETTPIINTGIAHRRAGVGQIGAGIVRAPLEAFQSALAAFVDRYARQPEVPASREIRRT
ncbi:MAG: DUF1116 domain-containing protein, partial [bacterium]